jgi:H+/Cl- antiporter ClcA
MSEGSKKELGVIKRLTTAFFKWLVVAGLIGVIGGFIGSLFYISVAGATRLREANPWLLYLLPVGGVLIVLLYRATKMEQENTNAIIDSVHFGDKVPFLLIPDIFLSTVITHLCGGSAGREGAALQIGGSIGSNVGNWFHLDDKDRRLAIICGMSAVFSALFGTPLTATLFALEVISVGVFYYSGFLPCIISSLVAFGITQLLHLAPTHFTIVVEPLSFSIMWRVAVLAVGCALISALFCEAMHVSERVISWVIPNSYVRAIVGGLVLIGLTLLVGNRDYNGTGMDIIRTALEEGKASPVAFLLKILFTAVTLGCGFRGGEVVPTFFVGATFGCVVGPLLGLPAGFSAAISLVAVFCGAVNCPIASLALATELFGASELLYFALAIAISYLLSGYVGLYRSQKIIYSKTRAEFINMQAK